MLGIPLVGPSLGTPGAPTTIAWSSIFGPSGNDRVGLFRVGSPNSAPLATRFTNGTASAGGNGTCC